MQGASIKITGPDGKSWTVPFSGMQLSVGRTGDNDIVLDQGGVSSRHCLIGRDPSGAFMVADQGSTNGTWIGDQRTAGPTRIGPGTQLIVGSYILSLEVAARTGAGLGPMTGPRPAISPALSLGVRGPLLRKSEDEHQLRRFNDRVSRYANEWDRAGRPGRLLLRGRNLRQAVEILEHGQDPDLSLGELEESFIRASIEGNERNKVVRIVGAAAAGLLLIGGGVFAVLHDWGGDDTEVAAGDEEGAGESDGGGGEGQDGTAAAVVIDDGGGDQDNFTKKVWVEHEVIPAETLEDIALRYGVTVQALDRWNGVGEGETLEVGRKLKVQVDPTTAPLPFQNITYRTEKRESWTSLAKRFDVSVDKLRAYNPQAGDELRPDTELSIWIEPKPLRRKADVQIPMFDPRPDAISVGAPKGGKLENAIQFPANDDLYKRRKPNIMWCGSHMAKHLQQAIANFRYSYEFEGEIVVADMSRKHGGKFDPHKSHQSGRDVDIWLPTLKGVYKKNNLDRDVRPASEEADWFALYGFLKALQETGEVQAVFLAYDLHDRVYQAAKLMGASEEELAEMIAYPNGAHVRSTLLQHSPGHTHHIHVRFKCGPNDEDCSNVADHDPGD
ncbi:MAG: penicillin-insensitive murein endopeptidase [Myxococcales bacterium]|nr:penicillin-insensitive murein endopeptidase [Myxococcales bacterium]